MSVNSKLEALRGQIRDLEGHSLEVPEARVLPFGDVSLDAALPQGGLVLGALHEICANGAEAELAAPMAAFAASIAARITAKIARPALWAMRKPDAYALGLARYGLTPERLIWVECRKDTEVLSVMEEALAARALAVVLGEVSGLSLKAARRLDAGAHESGTTALLLRRQFVRPSTAAAGPSGCAATRWCVSAAPGGVDNTMEPGIGPPRWRLDLEYCRNGRMASWIVEASHGTNGGDFGKAGDVRVVAELCHAAGKAKTACARKTA